MTDPASGGFKQLLTQRDFRNLWLGQLVSQVGDGVTAMTVMIAINTVTGSSSAVAAAMLSVTLPQLLFGLVAGVYADRWDRKRIMIVSDMLRGLLALSFLMVKTADDVWIFYVVGFLQASIGTLFVPAKSALIPAIVPPSLLTAANSLSMVTQMLTMMVGSVLAGVLVGMFGGPQLAFCFDALTFFVSAAFVARVAAPHLPTLEASSSRLAAVWNELLQGLVFLKQHRSLAGAMLVFAAAMLGMGAVNVLFIPFLTQQLHVPVQALGSVSVAQVSGIILGSALAPAVARRLRESSVILLGVTLGGILVASVGLAQNLAMVLVCMFATGVLIGPVQAVASTMFQTRVPNEMLGRVSSVMGTSLTLSTVVSMGLSGFLAHALGMRQVFFLAGGIIILAGLCSHSAMTPRTNQAL